ncbi:MAG: sigma-70 family RNA polymerase sigma factor [Polyangiaceae bacterium]
MIAAASLPTLREAFVTHERLLWGLAYRMTGSAADADDVVQDTFERALESPPPDLARDLCPWLVRVTMNVARDALRKRRSVAYVGPWLPSPLEDDQFEAALVEAADARYERRESASFAFLLALEALTPSQRAVLVLRDVLDFSVSETAEALDLSAVNVKVIHHRARRTMQAHDHTIRRPHADLAEATQLALGRMMAALLAGDIAAACACLTDDAVLLSDGGGEYHAALNPVVGSGRITRFLFGLQKKLGSAYHTDLRTVNGLPALLVENPSGRAKWAPRTIIRCELDLDGKISALHLVLATTKLTAISAPSA